MVKPNLVKIIPSTRIATALIAVSVVSFVLTLTAASAGGLETHYQPPVMRPPVDAPVSDPFRMPENSYGPGNRGIEYDTDPGQVVRAAAAGVVQFAGAVAGALHVTVDHGNGLRSSYSYLQRISVRQGASVVRGSVIGITGERLHFGVRRNDDYHDPAHYIGVKRVRVRLVAF